MKNSRFKIILLIVVLIAIAAAIWFFLNKNSNTTNEASGIFESIGANELVVSNPDEGQIRISFNEQTTFSLVNAFGEESSIEKDYLLDETLPNGITIYASDFTGNIAGKILIAMPGQIISGTVVSVKNNILTLRESNESEFTVKVSSDVLISYTEGNNVNSDATLSDIKPGLLAIIREQIIEKGEIVATSIDLRKLDVMEGSKNE